VGLWTFDGPDLTDKVYDRSGSGNHGYFIGGATSTAKTIGKLGQALKFDGQYVGTSVPPISNKTGDGTVSVWFNAPLPQTTGGGTVLRPLMFQDNTAGGPQDFDLSMTSSDSSFPNGLHCSWQTLGAGNGEITIAGPYNDGKWHLATCVRSGPTLKIYVDAVLKGSSTPGSSTFTSNTSFQMGGQAASVNRRFRGLLDDVRIYNRALSAAEVKQLYNLGK
jgi:hypothetical protein